MSSGKQPPMGWWQGDDGGWYPPDTHPDRAWRTLFDADRRLPEAARPAAAGGGTEAEPRRSPPAPTGPDAPLPVDPTWNASVAAAVGDGPSDAAADAPAQTEAAGPGPGPGPTGPAAPTAAGAAGAAGPVGTAGSTEPGGADGQPCGVANPVSPSWTSLIDRRLGRMLVWAGLGAVALIVLLAARATLSGDTSGGSERPATAARPTAVELSSAAPEAPSTTASPPAAPRRATMPVLSGLTSPVPASVEAAAATRVEGSAGGRVAVVKPAAGMVVARIAHGGTGLFAVHRLDDGGRRVDALVATVGAYGGSRLFDTDGAETSQLEVVADGPWSVELIALPGAATWSGREPVSGQGDGVLVVPGGLSRFTVAQVAHSGGRAFVVSAYTAGTRDLVASGVGRHDARHALAPGVLVLAITADGPWSITPRTA